MPEPGWPLSGRFSGRGPVCARTALIVYRCRHSTLVRAASSRARPYLLREVEEQLLAKSYY